MFLNLADHFFYVLGARNDLAPADAFVVGVQPESDLHANKEDGVLRNQVGVGHVNHILLDAITKNPASFESLFTESVVHLLQLGLDSGRDCRLVQRLDPREHPRALQHHAFVPAVDQDAFFALHLSREVLHVPRLPFLELQVFEPLLGGLPVVRRNPNEGILAHDAIDGRGGHGFDRLVHHANFTAANAMDVHVHFEHDLRSERGNAALAKDVQVPHIHYVIGRAAAEGLPAFPFRFPPHRVVHVLEPLLHVLGELQGPQRPDPGERSHYLQDLALVALVGNNSPILDHDPGLQPLRELLGAVIAVEGARSAILDHVRCSLRPLKRFAPQVRWFLLRSAITHVQNNSGARSPQPQMAP
mmetsp:Transcript_82496/g.230032  ORF Transcript_82496/g.230032 Transcript_82496/m.230032 type:complete len:358 (-) Transcript_82496:2-1075(-)